MPGSAVAAGAARGWGGGLAWQRGGRDEESWQLAVLAEELASSGAGEQEPPSEEELWGWVPDPDSDPPSDAEGGVPAPVWAAWAAAHTGAAPGTPAPDPALAGFGEGGVLDGLAPGAALAAVAGAVWSGGLDRLGGDELVGVVRAWRRLSSWVAAGELAVVAELVARCDRGHDGGGRCQPVDCVAGELACALTLTRRGADGLVDRALRLAGLPGTMAALRRGRIDVPKALTITDAVAGLDPPSAHAVEDLVLAKAAAQTTGELRAAVRRAVLAADPAAARMRRESAEKAARVELWDEPAGTKALAGRDLPPADVLAADKRISAIARDLKNAGAEGSLDLLRAKVYLALLAGQPPSHLLPTAHVTEPDGRAGTDTATGAAGVTGAAGPPGLDGAAGGCGSADQGAVPGTGTSVNLTVPLDTLLGLAESPGEVAGFGPVDAATTRLLAGAAAQHQATTWCLTVTGPTGRVLGHGCARNTRAGPGATARARATPSPAGQDSRAGPGAAIRMHLASARGGAAGGASTNLAITIDPLAFAACPHDRETAGYQLTPRLRHLIEIRDKTCSFPGCRRPATRCDKDHTIPFDQGGRTCECNLAPLCRAHHQLKQAHGWRLTQPRPGILQWTTPTGRTYTTGQT